MTDSTVDDAVAAAFHDEWARVVATLIRITGNWDLAEECAADAFTMALQRWQRDGIPNRPGAWLTTAARNRAIDLLFNEGYAASEGADLVKVGLSAEAIRLARVLVQLMPDEPEAAALLALMLLQDSRRAARVDANGDLITLEEQDRTLWDVAEIAEGTALLDRALRRGQPGPYQLQAAIAACHASAVTAADTDWAQIALLYRELAKFLPTPVVELNRAVAVSMSQGPEAGLQLVTALEASGKLAGYHLLPATRADLLRRLGRRDEAAAAYTEALDLATTESERRYLAHRLEHLTLRNAH